METVIYFLLSVLDSIAIISLMFRVYRFPFWEYFKEILLMAVIASVVSYVVRVVLGVPALDMAVQYTLYVLLLRFIIKVRFFPALLVGAVGYLSYTAIQFIVYPLLIVTGVVTLDDGQAIQGAGTYIIQITSDMVSFIVCWFMYHFNLGYACFVRPPHDFDLKDKMTGTNLYMAWAVVPAVIVIFSTLYWILNHNAHILIVLPTVAASLYILIYLSRRKDFGL
ncbi:hypothetical protein PV433_27235 [Paenibacillus sp. GYB004]|uniref:hypothetical protein n=1 Tax=Paenibacillus sp. GYB004 TaxID=2994393 RepID=UPI002F969885